MNSRYYSLDVFRGATVALMILVNNPGSWSYIYAPLEHASWHGCTPTDLVFPFFLFAVGNAMAFTIPRLKQAGTLIFLRKTFKRSTIIFLLGLFLNWSPFIKWENDVLVFKNWDTIRIMGVLQRISLCYLFGSLIVFFSKIRTIPILIGLILLLYWLSFFIFPTSGILYSLEGFWGTPIDLSLLGENHMYKGEGVPFEPEGLVSTIPAIAQVLSGYLTGWHILKKGKSRQMLTQLYLVSIVVIIAGLLWNYSFPMNKKIWTSSYVLFSTGLAIFLLATLIFLIEFKSIGRSAGRFFDVFGKNPLFIFVLSGFLPRLSGLIRIPDHYTHENVLIYISPFGWLYQYICKPMSDNLKTGSLIYAIMILAFYWLIAFILDKKKVYIKV